MLGVGFSFGDGALALARARVQRFMALGLGVSTPDPERHASTPSPETSREARAVEADRRMWEEPRPPDSSALTMSEAPTPPVSGREIDGTDFWAMLFKTTTPVDNDNVDDWYLMQLVPRDHSNVAYVDADDVGQTRAVKAKLERATFFAEPFANEIGDRPFDHALEWLDSPPPLDSGLWHIAHDGSATVVEASSTPVKTRMNLGKVVARADRIDDEALETELLLNDLMNEMFLTGPTGNGFGEPACRRFRPDRIELPANDREAAEMMARAGDRRAGLEPLYLQSMEVEERRSAVISLIGETAARTAADGGARENWGRQCWRRTARP